MKYSISQTEKSFEFRRGLQRGFGAPSILVSRLKIERSNRFDGRVAGAWSGVGRVLRQALNVEGSATVEKDKISDPSK